MQNKRLLYLLLPAVLLIWGIIIYRIVSALEGDENEHPSPASLVSPQAGEDTHSDTIILLINYPDPFLGKRIRTFPQSSQAYTGEKNPVRIAPAAALTPPVSPAKIAWPTVTYLGMVQNAQSKIKIALVKIGEHDYFIEQGKSAEAVQVVAITADSIGVVYLNEKRYFRK